MVDSTKNAAKYKPSKKELKKIDKVYKDIEEMFEIIQNGYKEFNQNGEGGDRTLREFVNDCQKRANSYVPTRADQDKEDWQANVFTPTTRNKVKTQLASIAKSPPEIAVIAKNEDNHDSTHRAETVKTLINASFVDGEKNPETELFFAGWDCTIQGTYIEVDDYIRIKNKVKKITDYDPATGKVSYDEVEDYVQDEAVSIKIPITNFLIWNIYIPDIQNQPKVAWVEYMDEEDLEHQYGDYKNFKLIEDGKQHFNEDDVETFFLSRWSKRTSENNKKYEVIKYYDKFKDIYRIIINGVMILDAPMLWGKTKKRYPFSKTIFEPFANSSFFYGNSLVNILMAEQDVENALINSLTDKTYRSLNKPMLIGRANRDNFDLEDEWVDGDTKIYVDDVSQVRDMPIEGATSAEISMLQIVQGGLSKDSTDAVQSGVSGSGSTAREIVIANERAEELKGLFFLFMKDLWLQKNRIRCINILMNYGKAKTRSIVGEEGEEIITKHYRSFRLPSAELSDGKRGDLEVQVVEDETQMKRPYELDVEEEKGRQTGSPTEIIQVTADYLDDYTYDIRILTNSLYQKSRSLKMAEVTEKIGGIAKLFPQRFMDNEEQFFRDYIQMYGDNPDKYQSAPPQPDPMAAMMGGAPPPQGLPQLA